MATPSKPRPVMRQPVLPGAKAIPVDAATGRTRILLGGMMALAVRFA
jgi:hypothetical protein